MIYDSLDNRLEQFTLQPSIPKTRKNVSKLKLPLKQQQKSPEGKTKGNEYVEIVFTKKRNLFSKIPSRIPKTPNGLKTNLSPNKKYTVTSKGQVRKDKENYVEFDPILGFESAISDSDSGILSPMDCGSDVDRRSSGYYSSGYGRLRTPSRSSGDSLKMEDNPNVPEVIKTKLKEQEKVRIKIKKIVKFQNEIPYYLGYKT